jgi:hypothetical protein
MFSQAQFLLGIQTAASEIRKDLLKATSNLINCFIKAAAVDIYSHISLLSSHAMAFGNSS